MTDMRKKLIKYLLMLFLAFGIAGFFGISAALADYSVYLGGITAWGDSHSHHSREADITLPYDGDYTVYAKFTDNGPEEQTHEELKLYIDGEYMGRTHDCGTGCTETEKLGVVHLASGTHRVKASHLWNVSDYPGANSIYDISAILSFIRPFPPTVDIKVNGSDGPISIDYNTAATLSWTSANADYCTASANWSGSKAVSGSESTGILSGSKTYTITCTGAGGSAIDTVTVNTEQAILVFNKKVRNLSDGTPFYEQVTADPGEVVSFLIEVKADNAQARDVIVRDILPSQMVYQADTLKINGLSSSGDIASGLDIGDLAANEQKTITFSAQIAGSTSFTFGTTQLTNSATASGSNVSASDSAKVIVIRKAVAGATTIPTGLTNNLFFDSFAFPLFLALMLLWFLKSNIIKFEQWVDKRKQEYQSYKSKKILGIKIRKIKLQELSRKIKTSLFSRK